MPAMSIANKNRCAPLAIMALMGAFFWAIRGTGGYGGETGGTLAGFGWGLLWYWLANRGAGQGQGAEGAARPYSSTWAVVALTAGVAFGGFTGYGVYTGWVRGEYCLNAPDLCRPIGAWTGYAALFVCGLHWGGNAGVVLAWCAPARPLSARGWAARIGCGVAGAAAALGTTYLAPSLFLPLFAEGIYSDPSLKTAVRALDSLHTIAPHVGTLVGFAAFEAARRDWRAVKLIATLALGFAVPFAVGGWWHTFQGASLQIGWWKNWEMTIGLGGGLALALAFRWFNRPGEAPPALGDRARAGFASGLHLWLPAFVVMKGCYDGVTKTHGLEDSPMSYIFIAMICVAGMGWWRRRKSVRPAWELAPREVFGFVALIVAAGFAVTVPAEWKLENVVLVVLYCLYIGGAALIVWSARA